MPATGGKSLICFAKSLSSQTFLFMIMRMLMIKCADNNHWIFSSGGVVLASRDGKIVLENSIDARLDVAFRKKLPEVFLVTKNSLFSYYYYLLFVVDKRHKY